MERLIPADTIDAEGNVWQTTGENIRNGAKHYSNHDLKTLVNLLFPVGSIYLGDNTVITSVGKWEPISSGNTLPLILVYNSISGIRTKSDFVVPAQTEKAYGISVRIWKRVA